jgi:hypothetical protein
MPQAPLVEPSGAASKPSLKTTQPGSSQMQTRLYRWIDKIPTVWSSMHAASNPMRTTHGPTPPSPAPPTSHH